MSFNTIKNFFLIKNLFIPEISEIILDFISQNKILRDRFISSSSFSELLIRHIEQPRNNITKHIIKPISYYQNPRYSQDKYKIFVLNSDELIAKHIITDIDIYISSAAHNLLNKHLICYISIPMKYLPFINENDSFLNIKHKMLNYYSDFDFSDHIKYNNNFAFQKITFMYRNYYSSPALISSDYIYYVNNLVPIHGRAQIFSYVNTFIEQIMINNNLI